MAYVSNHVKTGKDCGFESRVGFFGCAFSSILFRVRWFRNRTGKPANTIFFVLPLGAFGSCGRYGRMFVSVFPLKKIVRVESLLQTRKH